jgi:hypothetical protein
MSDRTPPPLGHQERMPPSLRRARTLWYFCVAMTFFTALSLFLNRSGVTTYLTDVLHQQDPEAATARLADDAQLILYAGVGLLAFLALIEALLTRVLTWPRQWPRLVMVPALLLHLVVAGACSLLIPLSTWQGWLVITTLVAGTVAAVVAVLRAFAPSVSRWIREQRAADAALVAVG